MLLSALAYVTGAKLSVRPSKIVAGLEAEKTNEFLQVLAAAVEKKVIIRTAFPLCESFLWKLSGNACKQLLFYYTSLV